MRISILALFTCLASVSFAQSVYAPLDKDYYDLIDRMDIKANSGNIFTSVKPYLRKDIARLADTLIKDSSFHFSNTDIRDLKYLQNDNWEWSRSADSGNSKKPILKYLYQKKNDFYAVNTKYFQLQLNPVAYFTYGKESDPLEGISSRTDYLNTRGAEIRGSIDGKVGFYSLVTDNQALFPQYVDDRIAATGAIPGEGYWKTFKKNGYDFYSVNGYIDFNITRHISTQFGQGTNFIGDGYRSLMLSDYSGNYLFWKIDTKVWKFEYINLYGEMVADNLDHYTGDINYPRKYMALHYLVFHVLKNFDIGAFENITFGNTDSVHNRGYDLYYLNPIIFYNAVENGLGAPDKDHIGINWKWNFLHHFSFYGTIFLDEFSLDQITAGTGWWGNKQAGQLGLKYVDVFGIHNLDMQLEGNIVPPYTYTHFSYSTTKNYSYYSNYTNDDQSLADPMGANFYEAIAILKYQPTFRLTLTGKLIYTLIGLDSAGADYGSAPGQNWGSNVMLDYNTRMHDYGNFIGQGARTTIEYLSFGATYQVTHNMFIDLTAIHRVENSKLSYYNSDDNIFSLSFRWNIAKRLQEF